MMLTRTFKMSEITDLLLPLTEFRKNLSEIVEHLTSPRILMKNDVPKAVIMPYASYVAIEQALEDALDEKLALMAEHRIAADTYVDSETFFNELLEDPDVQDRDRP